MRGSEAQSYGFRSTEAKHRAHLPALGYARVSTDEQAREGVSLEAQQSRIRAYCEAKELSLPTYWSMTASPARRSIGRPCASCCSVASAAKWDTLWW